VPTRRLVLSCKQLSLSDRVNKLIRDSVQVKAVAWHYHVTSRWVLLGLEFRQNDCTLSAGEPYHARSWVYVRLPKDLEQ